MGALTGIRGSSWGMWNLDIYVNIEYFGIKAGTTLICHQVAELGFYIGWYQMRDVPRRSPMCDLLEA